MKKNEIKQYADDTYGQVCSWINNCDSKASILLALIGVILSIAFTSDYILNGVEGLVREVVDFIKGEDKPCACASILILAVLGFSIGYFIDSIRNLLQVLFARFDDSRDAENPSISYYRSIGAKPYAEYKHLVETFDDDQLIEDKLREVHDCSKICTKKFNYYNAGIKSMKIGFVLYAVYVLLFIIKNSL